MRYVIIGNGVAGIEAAFAIRTYDTEGSISLITRSPHLFYYRPRLSEYLRGDIDLSSFTIYKGDHYHKLDIRNHLSTDIRMVDAHQRCVLDSNGDRYEYDKLLLATGAVPFVPEIKGVDARGVFTVRDVQDADNILEYSREGGGVVVIGGGLLGLEMAHYLRTSGRDVTIVEYSGRLLPNQLDEEGAFLLKHLLEDKKDLKFVLSETVEKILGDGAASGVRCRSGEVIDADMVLIATGIRSRMKLAQEAGLEVNRGIVVNDFMQTSDPDIYSAGDACEHNGRVYGIWPASREQGRIAGRNMAGIRDEYPGSVFSTTLKIPEINLFSAGDFNSTDGEVHIFRNEDSYGKLIVRDGVPIGAIILGNPGAMVAAMRVFDGKASPDVLLTFF